MYTNYEENYKEMYQDASDDECKAKLKEKKLMQKLKKQASMLETPNLRNEKSLGDTWASPSPTTSPSPMKNVSSPTLNIKTYEIQEGNTSTRLKE